jgi:uncharacterized membrane protein
MSKTLLAGQMLFGTALIGLGIEPFVTGHLPSALVPLQQPLPPWVAMLLGGALVASVVATARKKWRAAPMVVVTFPALVLLATQLPDLARSPRDPTVWSGVFQVTAFVAAALLAGNPSIGRMLFAAALVGFGVHHFMYAGFIASLIPAWIPGPLFWTYLTGVAFCAAAAASLSGKATRPAGYGLALMFLSWVLVVHLPRIMADPAKEAEWSSGLVALAMAAAGLLLAQSPESQPRTVRAPEFASPA